MATASIVGRKAYIRASTSSTATTSQTIIAELRDYTLTFERPRIVVTNRDSSGYEESLSGIATVRWTAQVNYLSTGAGQEELRNHANGTNPALANITFQQTTVATSKKWQGKTGITTWDVNAANDDAILGTVGGTISGKLTPTA